LPEVLKALGLPAEYQFILFGLGALTYARNPGGILDAMKVKSLQSLQATIDRRKRPAPQHVALRSGGELPEVVPPPAPATPKQLG